ncbi:RNA polymerase II transcription initiation/nucleotide excision repair factor TFIIH subunit TFB4 [Encephalitozoon intestinalis ATCC 50506]|uniref:General transcription and DNA repair factor IIH subunit TFB4 n=1 Tax=Encephalitozoon intestinalis (strain ATCC 50506) TaxID=876142 RepID=E0S811_ENCIT|nr:RNA polymerase II transcription initiation/nucleotide excision repair factor TFIIH subunit TFB4 [Encephalitozoon intestinalis ATCC 50506]ADM11846.1 RNA polymerase II transcription initiation/nucleotide excision repair factor TFIIH subunit TFB4 [Encephalitozoon intestinalis ATCC 50506]UTX45598.1 transcription factor Tfb4 [Encephalitozoon intestinalis]
MILFLLIDLKKENWEMTGRDLFNDVVVFLNAYHKSSRNNRIVVVSGKKILFDSLESSIEEIYRITQHQSSYDVGDLGYALCLHRLGESQIVIFTLEKERNDEYLRYLKCMFAAQRFGVRISAFSLFENKTILQCCAATGGGYSTSEDGCLRFLLSLLGTKGDSKPLGFPATCYCHNKQVLLGLVCPICLSVFCRFVPVCKKCKSKFSFVKHES